ncbi:hypothetical protein ACHAXA_002108 [Cyclostephanos tholiformis]|uniref:FAD dependent oxidoreductase domain-containing protein n=1 Tax=Cyclostephanos tholiformis TaxID=382380 RepID=A0ABD3R473_9STRA
MTGRRTSTTMFIPSTSASAVVVFGLLLMMTTLASSFLPSPAAAFGPHRRRRRHTSNDVCRLNGNGNANDDRDYCYRGGDPTFPNRTPRDVLIIGGGLAGLSVAYRIATTSSRHVTILERELPSDQRRKTTVGSFAAAGMLAPQSERLPAGPLLDICLESRGMYGGWVKGVEGMARDASLGTGGGGRDRDRRRRRGEMCTGEGSKYLWSRFDDADDSSSLEPWETGFHSTGGFLAPAFAGDAVATWSPQPMSGAAHWLDEFQVRELEPKLHPSVIGGWWFPEDASVDARRLTCSLRAACVGAGVQLNFGDEYEVKSLEMGYPSSSSSSGGDVGDDGMGPNMGRKCVGVHCAGGRVFAPKSVVVANGSWMRQLLPLPVTPHKGQSFSLRMPPGVPPPLSRVLFAQDTYIVPKSDGRIIVGATVEPGRYDGDVTPEGMMHCLSEATRLVPALASLPIEETWAGLRPTTPDKCPILGGTDQWNNVYLAGGYWRNGVLLAPKTGQLVGDLVINDGDSSSMTGGDRELLRAFSWDRFTSPGGGRAIAANARHAAMFYPVHRRSDEGVSTSVGTELGFYEGAAAAKGDRERDRNGMMFGISSEEEEALERAAGQGVMDARAFSFGDTGDGWLVRRAGKGGGREDADDVDVGEEVVEEDADLTETMTTFEDDPDAYTVGVIYDADEGTGATVSGMTSRDSSAMDVNEPTWDGYTSIIRKAYGEGSTAEATAEATRRARMSNRIKTSEIDESKIGAMAMPVQLSASSSSSSSSSAPTTSDLSSIYEKIKSNKALANKNVEMGESDDVPRPKLNFTIYHVDSKTREVREVPQYTSPGEFLSSIENEKAASVQIVNGFRKNTRVITDERFANSGSENTNGITHGEDDSGVMEDGSDEKTYDGYQAIQSANSSPSREEELRKMKEARMKNRAKS